MKGVEVVAAVEELLRATESRVVELDKEIANIDREIEENLKAKTAAIVDLANHYLPRIDQETVARNHENVRDDLTNILARKNRQVRLLRDQLERLQPEAREVDQQILDVSEDLHAREVELDRREREFSKELEQDEQLQEMAELALQARERLAQNEQRVDEIEREAAEKLPAYEASSLFQYLLNQDYGAPEYSRRGLVRHLDGWVARLIDYRSAKRSYDFLKVTPELMAEEVAKRRKQCEKLCQQLELHRDQRRREAGIVDLAEKVQDLSQKRETLLDESEGLQDRLEPVEEELAKLEASQGPFYEEALNRLVEFLEQTRAEVLKQWAETTSQPHDDEIVAEVTWVSDEAERLRERLPDLQSQRRRTAKRVREVQYVARSCRRSSIDSPRCSFPEDFQVETYLRQYQDGRIDQHELLQQLREKREFAPSIGDQAAKSVVSMLEHPTTQAVMQVAAAAAGQALRQMVAPKRRY